MRVSLQRGENTHTHFDRVAIFYTLSRRGAVPVPVPIEWLLRNLTLSPDCQLFCPFPSHPSSCFGQVFNPAPLPVFSNTQQIKQDTSQLQITTNRKQNQPFHSLLHNLFGLKQNVNSSLTGTLFNCVFQKFLLLECFNIALQVVCLDSCVSHLHRQDDAKCKL